MTIDMGVAIIAIWVWIVALLLKHDIVLEIKKEREGAGLAILEDSIDTFRKLDKIRDEIISEIRKERDK